MAINSRIQSFQYSMKQMRLFALGLVVAVHLSPDSTYASAAKASARCASALKGLENSDSQLRTQVKQRVAELYPSLVRKLAKIKKRPAEVEIEEATKELKKRMAHNWHEYETEAYMLGIDLVDIRSAEYVTVYRVISDTELKDVDLDWNYRKGNEDSSYGEDYVARSVGETLKYIYEEGTAVFVQYEIPAILLEYGKWFKEEASFVISAKQLKKFGVKSVAPFVARIGRVESARRLAEKLLSTGKITPPKYLEPSIFDGSPLDIAKEMIVAPMRDELRPSPYLRWVKMEDLEAMIRQALENAP